jgi:hypothetical protein
MDSRYNSEYIAKTHLVFEAVTGSFAYGLNTETSDYDSRGAFIPPPHTKLGLLGCPSWKLENDTDDIVYVEIAKLVSYFYEGAPNWIELLFVSPEHLRVLSPHWRPIYDNRKMFLTVQMVKKALGFIKGMADRSGRLKYKLGDKMEADQRKQVMHAVRMGRMMRDLLRTGEMVVDRSHERDALLGIKHGTRDPWSGYAECDFLTQEIEKLLETTTLPPAADFQSVNELVTDVTLGYWRFQQWT